VAARPRDPRRARELAEFNLDPVIVGSAEEEHRRSYGKNHPHWRRVGLVG
jgi:hypothetical protein